MKKITLLFSFIMLLNICWSQKLPQKFEVKEEASVWIGKEWNFDFTSLKNPMSVFFDGDSLFVQHKSGKFYWKTKVIDFEYKSKNEYGKITEDSYILQVQRNGFFIYVLIQNNLIFDEYYSTLKIPYIDKTGEVMSYTYFQ